MSLRRGFKAEANKIASDIRNELGLTMLAPLNPWVLAHYLAIEVVRLSEIVEEAPAVTYFLAQGSKEFSAMTVFRGTTRLIIHNDHHSPGRQSSNIAHELAHALLQHPPMPPLSELGLRNYEKILEEEATWLAGVLLIPDAAALSIARQKLALNVAADRYGVSSPMVRYRLNVTGARRRATLF